MTRPHTRHGWLRFTGVLLGLVTLFAGSLALAGYLVVMSLDKEPWPEAKSFAVGLTVLFACCAAVWSRSRLRDLVWSLRRTWRFTDAEGHTYGGLELLRGFACRGWGRTLVREQVLAIEEMPPSASEVEAAGPTAVAQELAELVPRTMFHRDFEFAGTHVLMLAAAMNLGAHRAIRYSLARDVEWRRGRGSGRTAWDRQTSLHEHVRVARGGGDTPPGMLEQIMMEMLTERLTQDLSHETDRREGGAPYRDLAPVSASLKSTRLPWSAAHFTEAVAKMRDAPRAADPALVSSAANGLSIAVYSHPDLARMVLELAESVERALDPSPPGHPANER